MLRPFYALRQRLADLVSWPARRSPGPTPYRDGGRRFRHSRRHSLSVEFVERRQVMAGDGLPEIAGLIAAPALVPYGSQITLTASGVTDGGGNAILSLRGRDQLHDLNRVEPGWSPFGHKLELGQLGTFRQGQKGHAIAVEEHPPMRGVPLGA